jgi:hypothetical protein
LQSIQSLLSNTAEKGPIFQAPHFGNAMLDHILPEIERLQGPDRYVEDYADALCDRTGRLTKGSNNADGVIVPRHGKGVLVEKV